MISFCVYKRQARFATSLSDLAVANAGHGLPVVVWNNNPAEREHYDRVAASFAGALRIYVHHSAHNLCGAGRFVAAGAAANRFGYSIFIVSIVIEATYSALRNATPHGEPPAPAPAPDSEHDHG